VITARSTWKGSVFLFARARAGLEELRVLPNHTARKLVLLETHAYLPCFQTLPWTPDRRGLALRSHLSPAGRLGSADSPHAYELDWRRMAERSRRGRGLRQRGGFAGPLEEVQVYNTRECKPFVSRVFDRERESKRHTGTSVLMCVRSGVVSPARWF
jgi:hypothetical protein